MGKIKGAALRARLQFLKARHGEAALAELIAGLPDMDRIVLSGTLLPSIWYPFQVLVTLDDAARRVWGAGDDLFVEAGEQVARQHARSIYKVFFCETDPVRVLRLAASIFGDYFAGGRMVVRPGESSQTARACVSDTAPAARSHCLSTLAYLRQVVETCTGRSTSARETRCRCWGDDACELELAWSQPLQAVRSA